MNGVASRLKIDTWKLRFTTVVHSETIPQHSETSLASLAELGKNGHDGFEFFSDPHCCLPLNAHEAEAQRLKGTTVYHKIYVIAGTLA